MYTGQDTSYFYRSEPAMSKRPQNYLSHKQNQSTFTPQINPVMSESMSTLVFHPPTVRRDPKRLLINVENSENRILKAIVNRKRKLTTLTTLQTETLEHIYKRKQYVTPKELDGTRNKIQLTDKTIKVWFQNRLLKGKEEPESAVVYEQLELRNVLDTARLDYIESQIIERTNEFGYVTLDNDLMKNLYKVINDALTCNVDN